MNVVPMLSAAAICASVVFTSAVPAQGAGGGQQFADLGECSLESGKVIQACRIGYTTVGTLNADKSNAVLVSIFPFAPSQYISQHGGLAKFLDASNYLYVFIDPVGNGVSISPSNSKAQAGAAFPDFTIGDVTRINQRVLTEALGIEHLAAVIGTPDMGSLQAFQWLTAYPDFVDKVVTLQGTPKLSASDRVYWQALLKSVEANLDAQKNAWRSPPEATAALWVMGENNPRLINDVLAQGSGTAEALVKGFTDNFAALNPHDVRAQFKAVLAHDALKGFKTPADAAAAAKAKPLFVISDSDEAFSPESALALAKAMKATPFVISDGYGAAAIDLIEPKGLVAAMRAFLYGTD